MCRACASASARRFGPRPTGGVMSWSDQDAGGGYRMYRTSAAEQYFVVDSHVHHWNGRPENYREGKEKLAKGWVDCFYDYHRNLSPADYVWPRELYERYPIERMMRDLFEEGYVDIAIFQPTYLRDF